MAAAMSSLPSVIADSISPSACTAKTRDPSGVTATPATKLSLLGRLRTMLGPTVRTPLADQRSSRTLLSAAPDAKRRFPSGCQARPSHALSRGTRALT
jgi:hypothetical protein